MIQNFTLRNYFVYFFAAFCLISCEKDDLEPEIELESRYSKPIGYITNLSKIQKSNAGLGNYMEERFSTQMKSSDEGVTVDTSHVIKLKGKDYESYIFKIKEDSTSYVLRNYLVAVLKDSVTRQYMITYNLDMERKIDTTNVLVEPLYGTDILNQVRMKCGASYEQPVWVPAGFTDFRCDSTAHTVDDGDDCNYYGGAGAASRIYYQGYLGSELVDPGPCADISDGMPTNGGGDSGGGTGSSGSNTDPKPKDDGTGEETIYTGIVPNKGPKDPELKDSECESVGEQFDDNDLQAEIDKIKAKIGETQEYGFRDRPNENNSNDRFKDLERFTDNPAKLKISANPLNIGVTHYHPYKFEIDDEGNYKLGRLTFSPQDINVFIGTLYGSSLDTRLDPIKFDLSKYYITMITERGVFTLKFSGNAGDLVRLNSLNINQRASTVRKRKRKYRRKTRVEAEQGLLQHLKYAYGEDALDLFTLYKSNEDGSVEKYNLNENDELDDPTTCHEA